MSVDTGAGANGGPSAAHPHGTTTHLAGAAAAERPGENARHAALFERVIERIYRYFRGMVRDRDAAEDCAQKTLLRLEEALRKGQYDAARSFNTWMWIKAHSVFVDHCRERGRRMEPLAEDEASLPPARTSGPAPGERLDGEDLLREVERRLGAEAFECFVLRYRGELTLDEVAETVGRDRKTVSLRIQAAHRLIDRLLGS